VLLGLFVDELMAEASDFRERAANGGSNATGGGP